MTDSTPPESDPQPLEELNLQGYAEESDEPEPEAPRRAASAQFVVDAEVGSQAAMRQAMDPAHQSLADALRLSYRVLQVVMVLLIVLFLFSGVVTVNDNESGVMLHWGAIQADEGQEALSPGLQFSGYPYPVGEFIIFQAKGRRTTLGSTYWPGIRAGWTIEQEIDAAQANAMVKPGRDGYVVTAGGDIGHLQMEAGYEIEQPVKFVHHVADADPWRDAERLVRLALQRAIVHVTAGSSLQDLVERKDIIQAAVKENAQTMLSDLETGIRLGDVRIVNSMAAMAIVNAYRAAQEARIEAQNIVASQETAAQKLLTSTAGEHWPELIALIEQYEAADELGDQAAADETLAAIGEVMRSDQVVGEVAKTVGAAEGYLSQVELEYGSAARKFDGLLGQYQRKPQFTVANLWMDKYAAVLNREETEKWYVPASGGRMVIRLKGSQDIQDIRRNNRMNIREHDVMTQGVGGVPLPYMKSAEETTGKAARLLDTKDGQVASPGGN